jgi:O-antigen ligase
VKGLIFTYALTYGGALIAPFNPFYGFLIYVAFANLKPDALWFYSLPQGNYSRTIAIAFLAGWLIQGAGSWKFGRAGIVVWSLLLFWMWIFVEALISPNHAVAWNHFIALSKTYLPFIAGVTLIDSVAKLKQLAWVIVITQGFLAFECNVQYYTTYFIANDWRFLNLDNNSTAITMVTAIGMSFFLGLHSPRWWQKAIAFASAAMMAHVVLFSMSRGGMLALIITVVTAFILVPKRPMHVLMFVVGCLIVLRLAGEPVQQEFATIFAPEGQRDYSAQGRLDLSRDAMHCMYENLLFGCGMENWGNIAPDYGWPRGKEVHNTWAQLGAELGVPGLTLIVGFYAVGCLLLFRIARERTPVDDPWLKYFARMVIASIAGFFIAAAAVTCEGVEIPYYTMVIGAGVLKIDSLGLAARPTAEPPFLESPAESDPLLQREHRNAFL